MPLVLALVSALGMVVARVLTNRAFLAGWRRVGGVDRENASRCIPPALSVLHFASHYALIGSMVWAVVTSAWLQVLFIAFVYLIAYAVPSVLHKTPEELMRVAREMRIEEDRLGL